MSRVAHCWGACATEGELSISHAKAVDDLIVSPTYFVSYYAGESLRCNAVEEKPRQDTDDKTSKLTYKHCSNQHIPDSMKPPVIS